MITWAGTFFIMGLIGVALGFGGIGELAINVGWIFLTVGIVLFLIQFLGDRIRR